MKGMATVTRDAVAQRLKEARARAGYSTAADAARVLGLKPATVRAHESGQNGLSAAMAATYAQAYNVKVEWLLYGRGEPAPATAQSDQGSGAFSVGLLGDDDRPAIKELVELLENALNRALLSRISAGEGHNGPNASQDSKLIAQISSSSLEAKLTTAAMKRVISEDDYVDLLTMAELYRSDDAHALSSGGMRDRVRSLINRRVGQYDGPLSDDDSDVARRMKFVAAGSTLMRALISAAYSGSTAARSPGSARDLKLG